MGKIPRLDPRARVVGEDHNTLANAIEQRTRIIAGPGVLISETPAGKVIGLSRNALNNGRIGDNSNGGGDFYRGQIDAMFFAKITGSTSVPTGGNQWLYSFVEVRKRNAGYTGIDPAARWEPDGLTGFAYNAREDINSDLGVQGNGVDVNTLPVGMEIQPVPSGVPVVMYRLAVGPSGYKEYWFEYENGVDGDCSA